MIDALSIDRFHELVASYGADPGRWPAELRGRAVGCLVESEAARVAWREADDLDTDLDVVTSLDTAPELAESVLAIADRPGASASTKFIRQVIPYAAAAIALVVGLAVPSPFRDTTGTALQDEVAVSEPEIVDDRSDNDDILTTLALVDTSAIADDESSTGQYPASDVREPVDPEVDPREPNGQDDECRGRVAPYLDRPSARRTPYDRSEYPIEPHRRQDMPTRK